MLLNGTVACVTGAAQGIGLAIAQRYAEEGAAVVLGDRDVAAGEAAAAALREGGQRAVFVEVDVSDEPSLQAFLTASVEWAGTVDVVVANAGVLHYGPLVDMPREEWDRTLAVNLTGVYLTCVVFARYFLQRGRGGRILCAASEGGKRGGPGLAAYCATKFGVIGLVQSLAQELAPHGITVNAVCPGEADTDMYARLLEVRARATGVTVEQALQRAKANIPLGHLADPRQIADAYVFLASPLADYVTGAALDVTGGRL
jgi:NAD(P)-dependent dehydrogenase (short-subunit alcohol dehydrogenase family)